MSYDVDALAKGNTGGRDAVAKDDADGKTAPPKSGRSTEKDKDEAKTSEVPNKQGRDKGNGKNVASNTSSDVDDTTLAGIMKILAGSLCLKLAIALLGGRGVKFSDSPRAMCGLPDMYRMLVAMCCGSKEISTAEGQYQESTTKFPRAKLGVLSYRSSAPRSAWGGERPRMPMPECGALSPPLGIWRSLFYGTIRYRVNFSHAWKRNRGTAGMRARVLCGCPNSRGIHTGSADRQ